MIRQRVWLVAAAVALAQAACGDDTVLTVSAPDAKAGGDAAADLAVAGSDAAAEDAQQFLNDAEGQSDAVAEAADDSAPDAVAGPDVLWPPADALPSEDAGQELPLVDDAAAPDLPAPDVPAPDVPGPDVPPPDVALPDVPAPDVPLPDVPAPDVPAPDTPAAEIAAPDAQIAETAPDAAETVAGPDVPAGGCGSDKDCDDKNLCTDDKCQPDGSCLWNLKKGPCDDGNPCTTGEACDFLQCKGGKAADPNVVCNDGNQCTLDTCDLVKGCQHANTTAACDDGNLCTVGEKCDGGACKTATAGANACDDGKPCTTDNCDLKTGACMWTAVNGACDDGDACTTGDTCVANKCVPSATKTCADDNDCTADACDSKTGQCAFALKAGAEAKPCEGTVSGGRCLKAFKANLAFDAAEKACLGWGGHLVHVQSLEDNSVVRGMANAVCGDQAQTLIGLNDLATEGKYVWTDGSPATFTNWGAGQPDNCVQCCSVANQGEDIVHLFGDGKWNDLCSVTALPCYVCERPVPTVACNDAAKCLTGGLCTAGTCAVPAGGNPGCDDANPCTTDACGADKGCTFTAVADGKACGAGGLCSKGKCTLGLDLSNPATNCAAMAAADPNFKAGLGWIDPDGKAGPKMAAQTWCEPALAGAAWTLLAVQSDDGQNTFTWNTKGLWEAGEQTVGSATQIAKDFRSPLLGSMPVSEVMFVHASGVWAAYPLGKGAQSLGQVVAATAGPVCYNVGGPGIKMSAGTLAKGGKLCDTDLYLNADDHDNSPTCGVDTDPEPTWGPAWNINRQDGCFDDPGWGGSLGPVKSEATSEGGTANPIAVGFGWALGLNKGAAGQAQNWMRVYGR